MFLIDMSIAFNLALLKLNLMTPPQYRDQRNWKFISRMGRDSYQILPSSLGKVT